MNLGMSAGYQGRAAPRWKDSQTAKRDLLLFACGVFQSYVAIFDSSLFDFITGGDLTGRLIVSGATIISAGLPFFFALGALKEGASYGQESVFFYEKMLKRPWFWAGSGLMTSALIPILFFQGRSESTEGLFLGGMAALVAVYLFVTAKRRAGSSFVAELPQRIGRY